MGTRKKYTRREFNKAGLALGAVALGRPNLLGNEPADLAAITANDPRTATREAVTALGGMSRFVKQGQSVDLLINFMGRIPPAHTNPEVFAEVVEMLKAAGAGRIRLLNWLEENRRRRNNLQEQVMKTGIEFHHVPQDDESLWHYVEVPRGEHLKRIRMFKVLSEADVFITIPAFKHHGSAGFSGALKLAMGTTIRADNRMLMHADRGAHLEQAIADLNTVMRPPDLIVTDAFEVLTTNGPNGPGTVVSPKKVIAATDRLAMDTYCAPIMNIDPATSTQLKAAAKHTIGQHDLSKLTMVEKKL